MHFLFICSVIVTVDNVFLFGGVLNDQDRLLSRDVNL